MAIALKPVGIPDFGPLGAQPAVPAATYAARADAAYERAGCDWLVIYGDREHLANIEFLSGFEPRFEEAVLVLRRPRSGLQRVDLLACGTAVELNSVELPAP